MSSDDRAPGLVHQLRSPDQDLEIVKRMLARMEGGGTGGGMSDDWKESVDRQLGQLHGDVRALLNRGVAAVVALSVLIGGQYFYFNEKFDSVKDRLAGVEAKVERIDQKLDLLLQQREDRVDEQAENVSRRK